MKKTKVVSIKGFTLIELAIVLAILGLLLTIIIPSISVQRDIRDYAETRKELAEYREALVGYALRQSPPYLPCPADIGGNGAERARAGGICPIDVGEVPWATLGLGQSDSWNNVYLYRVAPTYSNSNGFILGAVGDIDILDAVAGTPVASAVPVVLVSKGKNGFGVGADEQENTVANATFVSHTEISAGGNAFDDLVVWVPSTILFNRMVTAGRLP